MIKIKKDKVDIKGDLPKATIEILVGAVAVFEALYMNDEKELIDVLKDELKKMVECNSLEELGKYQEDG